MSAGSSCPTTLLLAETYLLDTPFEGVLVRLAGFVLERRGDPTSAWARLIGCSGKKAGRRVDRKPPGASLDREPETLAIPKTHGFLPVHDPGPQIAERSDRQSG